MSETQLAAVAQPSATPTAGSGNGVMILEREQSDRLYSLAEKSADPMAFINEAGKSLAQSGMLGVNSPARGATMMMICISERRTPLSVHREFHIMDTGKIAQRADWILAKFNDIGGEHEIVQRDGDAAEVILKYKGKSRSFRFTDEEAQQEPFYWDKGKEPKVNYATPRARMQMLWARVVSDAVRSVAPGVCAGFYTPEEESDLETGGVVPETGQVVRRGRPPGSANKPKAETQPASTGPQPKAGTAEEGAGQVIDASYTTGNANVGMTETTPLTKEQASEVNARTLVLVEIEELYGRMGKTMADVNASIAAKAAMPESKNPNVKTIDDMTDEQLGLLLNKLREAAAKNG